MKKESFGNIKEKIISNLASKNATVGNVNIDIVKETVSNDGVGFLDSYDNLSARDLNRPLRNIYREVENNNNYINFLAEMLTGDKKSSIIPNYLEEFKNKKLEIIPYNDEKFLRVPTGSFIFKDNNDTIVVTNKPDTELFEREISDYVGVDLHEYSNNIHVEYFYSNDNDKKILYNYTIETTDFSQVNNSFDKETKENKDCTFTELLDEIYSLFSISKADRKIAYSLEELIPLKTLTQGGKNYSLFFDKSASGKGRAQSYSNKYFIADADTNEDLTGCLKLFTFTYSGGLSNIESCLEVFNPKTLEFQDVYVTKETIRVNEVDWKICEKKTLSNLIITKTTTK